MIKSNLANQNIMKNILGGKKIPHSTSQPVIYEKDGKYYLASFVFFYNREDIESGMINRPTMWAISDIENGEIIEVYNSKEKDFSSASYDVKYNVRSDTQYDTSKEYYEKAYAILDEVRRQIIKEGTLNREKYDEYLNMILENIPENYKRFYLDLSV